MAEFGNFICRFSGLMMATGALFSLVAGNRNSNCLHLFPSQKNKIFADMSQLPLVFKKRS